MTQNLNQLAEEILTSTVVDETLLSELATQLHSAGLLLKAEAAYSKLFYHDISNDHNLAKLLSFLTSTNQIRKALDFLIHIIADVQSSKDRETWLIQLVNSLPNNEDWQKRTKRFTDISQVVFKELTSLEFFCAAKGIEINQIQPSEIINLPHPKANKTIYQSNFTGPYVQPAVQYAVIENITTSPSSFMYQTTDCAIRPELASPDRDDFVLNNAEEHAVFYIPEMRSYSNKGVLKRESPTKRVKGMSLSLLCANAKNYFHFIYEQMPKVLLLAQIDLDEPINVLIPDDVPKQFKEMISYYGIKHELIPVARHENIEMEKAIIFSGLGNIVCDHSPFKSPTRADNCISKLSLNQLREQSHPSLSSESPKKIYLLRAKGSGGRTALNDDEIAAYAQANGFTIVSPESLSFSEQVELFHNAEVIMGISGAAFANMIYCRPETKLIVISPYEGNMADYAVWTKPAYFFSLDLSFFCTNNVGANHVYRTFCDKRVDISELNEFVESIV